MRERLKATSAFERLVALGSAVAAVGFALVWLPLAFLSVAAVLFAMAYLVDSRVTR